MKHPKRVMIVAWGSRGDLQPVTALALRLKEEGRDVCVFATPPATNLLKAHGIDHVEAKENVADFVEQLFGKTDLSDRSMRGMMRLAKAAKEIQNSLDYLANQKADMQSALAVAQDFQPDVLITPNIIYGPYMSIAELLRIPVVTLDLQINYPTSDFPLFTMEVGQVPKSFNRVLYWLKARIYPKTIRSKFDMMRDICGLPCGTHTDGTKFKIWPHDLPQFCAASPSLFSQPIDWPSQKHMGGWFFTPDDTAYTPPPSLVEFLKHRPVFIGFGSMKGNPEFCTALSTVAIKGLKLAGVKGVLLGGWAGLTRDSLDRSTDEGKELFAWAEENVFEIDDAPFDWLFPQCSAVVHHGGAGTLAAGICAGRPTIVCAMQGDQPFHGSVVQSRGLGRYLGVVGSANVTSESLAAGIVDVTTNEAFAVKALTLSQQIAKEDGCGEAVHFIDEMAATYPYPWPLKIGLKRLGDQDI